MASVSTLEKTAVTLKLHNGTTATGAIKTVSINYPSIDKDAYNADKVLAIEQLLVPVLAKTPVKLLKTDITSITNDE